MVKQIITLTTDFGLRDPYVAEMKGVILEICPEVQIVDISHEIEKFNVKMASFLLASSAPCFKKSTIHVCVVDPTVGSERKPILIQTRKAYLIGPDNGVLSVAATKQGIIHAHEIQNHRFMRPNISRTFHGRDIFAPIAAYLAKGVQPSEFGAELPRITIPSSAIPIKKGKSLIGEIVFVDSFGNITTNISERQAQSWIGKTLFKMTIGSITMNIKLRESYSEGETGEVFAIFGSHDFLEISVNKNSASRALHASIGEKIVLKNI